MANRSRRQGGPNIRNTRQESGQAPPAEVAQRIMSEEETARWDKIAADWEADIVPVRNLVVLKVRRKDKTDGGLYLPDGAKSNEPAIADVIAAGPGLKVLGPDGKLTLVPCDFQKGDVIYPSFRFQGQPITIAIGKNEYVIAADDELVYFSKQRTARLAEGTVSKTETPASKLEV
jgi:co-chaperonin GroES (HSP10)